MIKIDDRLVEHLCRLSKLSIADWDRLKADLQKIIDYFDILNEIDTSSFEPMYTPVEDAACLRDARVPEPGEEVDDIVQNFPEKQGRLIKIPGIYG